MAPYFVVTQTGPAGQNHIIVNGPYEEEYLDALSKKEGFVKVEEATDLNEATRMNPCPLCVASVSKER